MHTSISRAPFALVLAATLAASFAGIAPARAQEDDSASIAAAPPVARLSVVDGQVALKHGDSGDQAAAVTNAPVVAGDYITTGDDGRAEVQLDADTVIRAGADTQIRFTQLDGSAETAQIAQGSMELRVFGTGQDNVQVQTPSVDVAASEAGAYLITVTGDGNTQLTTRSGSLTVMTPQGSQEVDAGRTMVVAGNATDPQYQYVDEVAQTDLEQWGNERDTMLASAQTAQAPYVNDDMVGSADLNQYGQWVDIPGYGNAWVPSNEPAGWTPYSDGTWVNLNYYGPTWVGAEPWGWAPYHYGRWFYAPTVGWAWNPGPRYARPVWSPALVAFFGFGGGGTSIGLGLNFGNVGWVPLAPGENYRPWWGSGASLAFGVSYTNYRNYAHGFVGVPYSTWQRGFIRGVHPMTVAQLHATHFSGGSFPVRRFDLNTRYTNRSLANTFPKPQYRRFDAIRPVQGSGNTRSYNRSTESNGGAGGWNGFGGAQRTAQYTRPQRYQSAPNREGSSMGWNRFGSSSGYGEQREQRPSYAQPQQRYQQQQYGYQREQRPSYAQPQQRYQQQQYGYGQRSYAQPQQRYQYSQRQNQSYQPRQYQSYQTQSRYAPQQRQYAPRYRQQAPRSAPARSNSRGDRPHGPGRT